MAKTSDDNRVQLRLKPDELSALEALAQPGEKRSDTAGRLLRQALGDESAAGAGRKLAGEIRALREDLATLATIVLTHVGKADRREVEAWVRTHLLSDRRSDDHATR